MARVKTKSRKILPKPRQFPLLLLPYIPKSEILKKLDFHHQLTLSLCSKKTGAIVSEMNPKIGQIELEFTPDKTTFIFQSLETSDSPFYWTLTNTPRDVSYNGRSPSYQNQLRQNCLVQRNKRDEYANAVISAIKHIQNVFQRPIDLVKMNVVQVENWENSPIWGSIQKTKMFLRGKNVSDEALQTFFEKVEIDKFFVSFVEEGGLSLEARYDSFKNFDCLAIRNARWARDVNLEQFTGRVLWLHETRISASAINQWLKSWQRGAYENAEFITIGICEDSPLEQQFFNLVLADIDHEPIERYKCTKIEINGVTIGYGLPTLMVRGPNGKTASISILKDVFIQIENPAT